jgi:hypothetical protein
MRSTKWWESLSAQDRRLLRGRLRYRDDVIVARFVEPDASDEPVPSDFYEYLVGHEVYLEDGRSFHICSAHAQARAVVEQGRIAHDFECPRASATCPLRQILAQRAGHDCLLQLAKQPEGTTR